MKVSNHNCLSGGLFFNLILSSIKEKVSKKDAFVGKSAGLSAVKVMGYLMDVVKPDRIKEPDNSFKTIVSNYRNCRNNGGDYIVFNDKVAVEVFDGLIKSNFQIVLNRMADFVANVVDVENKGKWLVQALLDVIYMDESISETSMFYIKADGKTVQKRDLAKICEYDINSFLLGVLHFIVTRQLNNINGKEFLDKYFGKKSKHEPLQYLGGLGEGHTEIELKGLANHTIAVEDSIISSDSKKRLELRDIFFDSKTNKLHIGCEYISVLPALIPPENYAQCELKIIGSLMKGYKEDMAYHGKEVKPGDVLPEKYIRNLQEQRENFYSALRICRVLEDTVDNSEDLICDWKETTYDYISDTAADEYPSGYKKMLSVMKKVVDISKVAVLENIEGMIKIKERKGCCHLLVQDGRLDWSIHEEDN